MENNVGPNKTELKGNKKKEKKSVTLKKLILRKVVFIVVFLVIAIGVTYYFILNTENGENEEIYGIKKLDKTEETQKEFKLEKTIDLEDTYNMNDLEIKSYKEKYNEIEVEYYQIDGLKNSSIQTKINYNLKNDVEKAIDEAFSQKRVTSDNLYVYSFVVSNFANTISIYYDVYAYDDEENDYKNLFRKYISENYDLTTGNRLKLKDLFVEDENSSKKVLRKIYNNVISSISDIDYNDNLEGIVKNYNDVEEEIFEVIYNYNEGNDIPFYFDEQRIMLLDYHSSIMYRDNLDYITIYDKYKTEDSIFDGTYNKLENIPVLVKREEADYIVLEQGENYYIDISLFQNVNEKNDKVYKTVKNMIDNYVDEIKKEAKNSNKFLIINRAYVLEQTGEYNIELDDWISDGYYNVNISCYKFEVTKSLFKSEIYDKIIYIFRNTPEQEMGEVYLYDNLFGAYLTYDEETGEEYLINLDQDNMFNSNLVRLDSDGNLVDNELDEMFWDIND